MAGQRSGLPEPLKRSASHLSIMARQRSGARQLALIVLLTLILIVSATTLLPILLSAPMLALPTSLQALPGAVPSVGQLSFGSSGQLDPTSSHGLNDSVALHLHDLVPPAPGQRYDAWLLPDRGERNVAPILLGTLSITAAGTARLSYTSPAHVDLLASMSRVLITEQPDHPQPALPSSDPATWRYGGSIPDTPTPGDENHFSLLDHLRHLLAKEPMLERLGLGGGLGIWLYRNGGKVWEWASAARDDWAGGQATDLIHRQVIRILDYLDGASEVDNEVPAGTPWLVDPRLGSIGLLEITPEQDPLAYLTHLDVHLQGFMFAPGHTQVQ